MSIASSIPDVRTSFGPSLYQTQCTLQFNMEPGKTVCLQTYLFWGDPFLGSMLICRGPFKLPNRIRFQSSLAMLGARGLEANQDATQNYVHLESINTWLMLIGGVPFTFVGDTPYSQEVFSQMAMLTRDLSRTRPFVKGVPSGVVFSLYKGHPHSPTSGCESGFNNFGGYRLSHGCRVSLLCRGFGWKSDPPKCFQGALRLERSCASAFWRGQMLPTDNIGGGQS